jgi:hypothetical protein
MPIRNRLPSIARWRKPRVHLIHIGKTGGTAVKDALKPLTSSGRYQIELHSHDVDLQRIPQGDKFFFAVRDPLDRFVSGFNSRKRRGRPRYDFPWSTGEERAFNLFPNADALGSALSSDEARRRAAARDALISIKHVRDSYWQWFRDRDHLERRLDDLLLVMWFPSLDSSFAQLCELLGLPSGTALPTDSTTAHHSPQSADRSLSKRAKKNLYGWYSADVAFVEFCTNFDCFAGNADRSGSYQIATSATTPAASADAER